MNENLETSPSSETLAIANPTKEIPTIPAADSVEAGSVGMSPTGILGKIMRAVDWALSVNQKRTGWELTCYMILDGLGGQELILGPKTKEKFRAYQASYDHAVESINSHTEAEAKKAWQAHFQTLSEAASTGTSSQHEGWSLDDWKSDYEQKVRAAHAEMERIYRECFPFCQDVGQRFVSIATRKVNQMEQDERDRHENFGVPYTAPSNLVVSFKKSIFVADSRVKTMLSPGSTSPRSMLPYLDF